MRKLLAASLLVLLAAGCACADFRIKMDEYKCATCQTSFYCFRGEDISKIEVFEQPKRLHPLSNTSGSLKNCSNGYPMHSLLKRGTTFIEMEYISRNMDRVIVVTGGRVLDQKLRRWECMLCGKEFYSFSESVTLNIKDWDVQPDHIKSLKGMRGIPQCPKRSDGYFGHVFKLKQEGSLTSVTFASSKILDNIYFIK